MRLAFRLNAIYHNSKTVTSQAFSLQIYKNTPLAFMQEGCFVLPR